ncbi:hypothetical protein Tco_1496809, partial [Tanacetum coccineum]
MTRTTKVIGSVLDVVIQIILSENGEEDDEKDKDEMCLMAHASSE